MKTIFHLHGVIWLGVAEHLCYGNINIMEVLTLLSLSHWDQCVHYRRGYITHHRPMCAHIYIIKCNARLLRLYANTHATADIRIHTCNPKPLHTSPSPTFALLCVCVHSYVCVWVIECSNDHSPDTGILTAAAFHRHIDWHAISYGGVKNQGGARCSHEKRLGGGWSPLLLLLSLCLIVL